MRNDPKNAPKYLDALATICNDRQTEELTTLVASERSTGRWATSDLQQAYVALGLPDIHLSASTISEDTIMQSFNDRLDSSAPVDQKQAVREAMKLIANVRDSDFLRSVLSSREDFTAEDFAMSPEEAYAFLQSEQSWPDDIVKVLYEGRVRRRMS